MRQLPLLAALFLGACAATGPAGTAIDDLRGSWQSFGVELPMGTRIPTLRLAADGTVTGCAGINRFRSALDTAALARGEWRLSPLAGDGPTMAGTEPAMRFEVDFARHLRSADRVSMDDGLMVLRQGDQPLLAFARVSVR